MLSKTNNLLQKSHLDYIDGLKGLAILMVLFFHVSLDFQEHFYFSTFPNKIEHLSRGVHLFFIVSGFAIANSNSQVNFSKNSLVIFYLKRFFRIFPLWWGAVTLYYFFYPVTFSASDYMATMFLYFGFLQNAWAMMVVPVAWSLFVEEFFYLLFPLWNKTITNWKSAFIALVLSYFVAFIWYSIAPSFFQGTNFVAINPLGNYYAFFLGILLFHLNQTFKFGKNELKKGFYFRILDLLCFAGIIVIFLKERMAGTLALAPIFVSAFYSKTLFGRFFRLKIMRQFCECCYSIYLFHSLLIIYLHPLKIPFLKAIKLSESYGELQVIAWFFVIAFFALILGKVSWYFLENNSIHVGKFLINKIQLKNHISEKN